MTKRWITGILAVALTGSLLAGCGSAGQQQGGAAEGQGGQQEQRTLVISTWGFAEDFFRKEVYEPFEKEHNVKIVLEIGNNAERLNKVRQGSSNVDLMYLSDYYAQQGIEAGIFEKIDRSRIPNLNEIYESAKAPLGEDYGPAYTIGALGIAYDPQAAGREIKSWKDLWSPELAKKITMPNITSTSGPMMVDAASIVSGSETFNEDQAFAKLKELNPGVVKYYSKTSEFVSKNKELAEEFINWHLSKEVQEKSAKGRIDSPVNKNVQLSAEEAQGITYGAEVVEKLRKLDMKFVNEQLKNWIDRFNREVTK